MSFASLKNYIALYHFSMYVDAKLMAWFVGEYPKHVSTRLDMGKSCIRFKKPEQIPFELIAQLSTKRDVEKWVASYEEGVLGILCQFYNLQHTAVRGIDYDRTIRF